MNDYESIKLDQEVRRHFAGIAQGILDALHIWCATEMLFTASGVDWKHDTKHTDWRELPDRLIQMLDDLQALTVDEEHPTDLPWYQWRCTVTGQTNELSVRVGMLIDTL